MQYEGVVDVFQTVRALRTQRPAMVQTEDQYQFCYRAALEYLSSFDTPYPEWHTAVLELGVWNRYVILRLSTSPLPPYVTFRLNVSTTSDDSVNSHFQKIHVQMQFLALNVLTEKF